MTPTLIWILGIIAYVIMGLLTGIVMVRYKLDLGFGSYPYGYIRRDQLLSCCCIWPIYWGSSVTIWLLFKVVLKPVSRIQGCIRGLFYRIVDKFQ